MFKNFWCACQLSNQMPTTPRKLRRLGKDLVVFRGEYGRAVVMSDLCIHRGASLSMGRVEGDCIRCPYHGWKFDRSGQCTEIPSNTGRKRLPQRARVDGYPTAERHGLVWAFMGDLHQKQRPLLPVLPEFDDPQYKAMYGTFDWEANYERVMENGVDVAHAAWVHAGSFGNPDQPQVDPYEVEEGPWSASAAVVMRAPAPKLWPWGKRVYREVKSRMGVQMPNVSTLDLDLPRGMKMRLFDVNVPVDANRTRTIWIMLRTFAKSSWADGISRKKVMKIFLEVQPFVESQRPELVPEHIAAELHVNADAMQLACRQLRQQSLDADWWIGDRQAIHKPTAVIRSPARRDPEAAGTSVFDA